jgi:hypothetical protein
MCCGVYFKRYKLPSPSNSLHPTLQNVQLCAIIKKCTRTLFSMSVANLLFNQKKLSIVFCVNGKKTFQRMPEKLQ